MNEMNRTLAYAGAAALLAAAAWITSPHAPDAPVFKEEDAEFYPDFKNPLLATTLEIVDYEEETDKQRPFKVTLKGGKYGIPLKWDHPADAKDRLAKTAAAMMDLKKEAIRSDNPKEHEGCGVLDPLEI